MSEKKINKIFIILSLVVTLVCFGLIFINSAFIPATILWLSLLIFNICYYIKDNKSKILLYVLFIIGVLLIIGSLIYTVMRVS